MISLVLEGGTFRPIFSAGIMDALLYNNINLEYVIGVSAGITNGYSYISKQKGRNLDILVNFRHDKRYIGKRNLLKNRSLFGLDFAYDEVPNRLYPFDWDEFYKYTGKVLVGVTNANTGMIEYKNGMKIDKKCTMLRATCAIPYAFPCIELDNEKYYDGGLADPIPIRKAIEDGNDKHIIILTRPKGYIKSLSKTNLVVANRLKRKYPKLEEVLLTRHIKYNDTVKYCEELEKQGKAFIFRPKYSLKSFEKNIEIIKESYKMGYNLVNERLDELVKFING